MSKIKNIFNLTKILFLNSFQNPYIIDQKTNKINKKSIFIWFLVIIMVVLSYLSYMIVDELIKIGQPTLFLNFFFLIIMIIMIFQVILASTNVYFFSRDLEVLLPLPIKTEKLLISKFNTLVINLYFSEIIFVLFPLIIYGICTYAGIIYYLYLILILLIFPILPALFVSIITMLFMKLSKLIKNKDIFQIIITIIFIAFVFWVEFKIGSVFINKTQNNENLSQEELVQIFSGFHDKLKNIYNYFLELNPTINFLNNYNKLNSIFNLLKIIFIDFLFFILFIFVGKKYYLKNILKNNNNYYLNKNKKNIIEKKSKKLNIKKSYIKKEFKLLFKNPIFFMQCILPIYILIISLTIIVITTLPNLQLILNSNLIGEKIEFSVDLNVICIVIAIIQLIFAISNISITAISREGKNANYLKFIPVELFKQFIYKSVPQIIINNILILFILILIKIILPKFDLIYLFLIFIISNLFNIINSELMVLVDLWRPNLNWKSDYEATKSNNKIFQYGFSVISILILVYFYKVLNDIKLIYSCLLIILILFIFILLFNKIIKININKFFNKINN